MKVVIDTRHDTLEEALAVVALAFGSDENAVTSKAKRPTEKPASGRNQRGRGVVVAEREVATTAIKSASPSETNGSRRPAGAEKTATRKATGKTTSPRNEPPKKPTSRKTLATGQAASRPVAEQGNPKAAASKAPATTGAVPKSATANGSGLNTKRVAAKKATATKAKAEPPKSANVSAPGQSDTIRAWARSRGMQVADAGRMSAAVISAYNAHHN